MQEFGVKATRKPTLEFHGGAEPAVKLVPRPLWIIGNNGRVDMKRGRRRYLNIDTAQPTCGASACQSLSRVLVRLAHAQLKRSARA